jgi:glycosyltransferase involved in cell wall biosynthesis
VSITEKALQGCEAFRFSDTLAPVSTAPLFTVVMPVFLGEYRGHVGDSASNKVEKFHRAVESVGDQIFQDWELVIVVDGCPIAGEESKRYEAHEQIRVIRIPNQRTWSPEVRNAGLREAQGSYAIYLDADDVYGTGHLETVFNGLHDAQWPTWGALDEQVWDKDLGTWKTRMVQHLFTNTKEHGWHAGTPNMVHRTDVGLLWPAIEYRYPHFGYSREDRAMVKELQSRGKGHYIPGSQYYVCHIPGQYDL